MNETEIRMGQVWENRSGASRPVGALITIICPHPRDAESWYWRAGGAGELGRLARGSAGYLRYHYRLEHDA